MIGHGKSGFEEYICVDNHLPRMIQVVIGLPHEVLPFDKTFSTKNDMAGYIVCIIDENQSTPGEKILIVMIKCDRNSSYVVLTFKVDQECRGQVSISRYLVWQPWIFYDERTQTRRQWERNELTNRERPPSKDVAAE